MAIEVKKWSTQIKKGYLDLCVMALIQKHGKLYGFQLISLLEESGLEVKEGTLYPMLSRMNTDKLLKATWETKDIKGHPRKFYSLSKQGAAALELMRTEFDQMYLNYKSIDSTGVKANEPA